MNGVFERRCVSGTSQCDFHGCLKLSALLEAMQDTANEHCRELQVGREALAEQGLTWVLFRINVQISRYPRLGEAVTVRTFTKGSRFKFCPRYYEVTDEAGRQLCKAASLWMLMETDTRKTVSTKERGIELPDAECVEMPLKISVKAGRMLTEGQSSTFTPPYTDLDFNGHVNNIRYADWLYNRLGFSILGEREIASLSIDYNYEIPPETVLQSSLSLRDDEFQFSGNAEGKLFFLISGRLRTRISGPLVEANDRRK